MPPRIVDGGHPDIAQGLGLGRVLLVALALDLDHQIERFGAALVDPHDEIGPIAARLAAELIGHLETEIVVLRIGDDLAHAFQPLGQPGLPRLIVDDMVQVALVRPGREQRRLGRIEIDVPRRAFRIVGVEDRQERAARPVGRAGQRRRQRAIDLLDRADGERTPFQELRSRIADAGQAFGEPSLGDARQFGIAPDLKRAVLVPEIGAQQEPGDIEHHGLQAELVGLGPEVEREALADQRLDLGHHRQVVRGDRHPAVLGEDRLEGLAREDDPITLDIGEADLARRPVLQGADARHLGRRLRRDVLALLGEGEGHAEDIRIFDGEEAGGRIDLIGDPPEAAPHHLLAEQLRAESAHAHDVRDGVGVPPLGQHGNRDHAADIRAELAGTPDRVHHLAQNVGIGQLVDVARVVALPQLLLEGVDLRCGELAEILRERLAGVELFAVDQQRPPTPEPFAAIVDIGEERQLAGHQPGLCLLAFSLRDLIAGNPVGDQLRRRGVVAHDDEDRRAAEFGFGFPCGIGRLVVIVKRFGGLKQQGGQALRIHQRFRLLAAALLRQILGDVPVHVAELRQLALDGVVEHRQARHLDDAALDGVEQAEIGRHPREQSALGITRAPEEEGGCRDVVDGPDAEPALECLDTADPDPGGFLVALRLLLFLGGHGRLTLVVADPVAVAVVSLVVQNDDVLAAHQVGSADAGDHLAFRLCEGLLAVPPAEDLTVEFRDLLFLPEHEGVIVGDDDPRLADAIDQIGRDEVQRLVDVLGVGRDQDTQPVADGDAGRDDQEGVGKRPGIRAPRLVDGVPRDDHPHDRRLARACRHLGGETIEAGVGLGVGVLKLLAKTVRRDLGQIDQRLDSLALAKEQPPGPGRFAPMEEQTLRLGRHAPLARRQSAPLFDMLADFVDQRIGGDLRSVFLEQREFGLFRAATARRRDRNDLNALPSPSELVAGRLALIVEFVMIGGRIEGRRDDRVVREPHGRPSLTSRVRSSPIGTRRETSTDRARPHSRRWVAVHTYGVK